MPYSQHKHLETPPDDEQLWRYMDLAKFAYILVERSLFFASGKTLSAQDKFERQPTSEEVDWLKALASKPEEIQTYRDQVLANFREAASQDQKYRMAVIETVSFFHCWHMNDAESDAMWKIYDKGAGGVAIRSTVGKLKKSFDAAPDNSIFLGKIRYYMGSDENPPNTEIYIWQFMRKRAAFEHEKEVRAVVIGDTNVRGQPGLKIPVDVDELISSVVISPYAEPWVEPVVKTLVQRLGYNFNLIQSEAAGPPPGTRL
jgi:hypothetical protein